MTNNEFRQKAAIVELREALTLADCALSGSNMNLNSVERAVKLALNNTKKWSE